LKQIGKKFKVGRQEDAHEFLNLMMECFVKSETNFQKMDTKLEEQTSTFRIFGGKLKN
jgi:hypothetical protein